MSQLLRCLSTNLPIVFLALTAQLRNARVQKVYTSSGLRPTTRNRSVHLWTLTKIWSLQSLRLRMPWLEASTSFQYSQLYKGSVVSRLTSTISQSISIYHAAHGRVLPGLISGSNPNASVSVRRVVGSQPPLFGPYLESNIPWILQLNKKIQKISNWKLQPCKLGKVFRISCIFGWDIDRSRTHESNSYIYL